MYITLHGNFASSGGTENPQTPNVNQIILPSGSDYENYMGKFYNYADGKFYTNYNPKTGGYIDIILPTSEEIIAELESNKAESDNIITLINNELEAQANNVIELENAKAILEVSINELALSVDELETSEIVLESFKSEKINLVQKWIDEKKVIEEDIPESQKEDFTFTTVEEPPIIDGKL